MATPQVSTGPQGNTVPQATIVTQGPQGVQGWQGNTGYQGWQGTVGYQGVTGTQGYVGVQGYQGYAGPPSLAVCDRCGRILMHRWNDKERTFKTEELSKEEAAALVLMERAKPTTVPACGRCLDEIAKERRGKLWHRFLHLIGIE